MTSKDSEEFVFRGSAFTRSVDLVICGTRVLVMITPNNYWLRIYKYYSINSINRLVPVGKGEGERCDECGSQNTYCQIACAHRLLYSITLRSLLRCNKAKLFDVNNAYKLIGFTAH